MERRPGFAIKALTNAATPLNGVDTLRRLTGLRWIAGWHFPLRARRATRMAQGRTPEPLAGRQKAAEEDGRWEPLRANLLRVS